MRWKYPRPVRQREDLLVKRPVQLPGQLIRGQPGRSEQIGPPDVTDEQRVTGEDPEGLGAVAVLIDHDADRLGRVSRRRPDLELYLTEVDPLSVGQGFDVEVGLRALAVADRRSVGGELEMTREEVGVNVGLDDPLDPQAALGRVLQIDRHVAVRVHHNRPARGLVADHIRQLRQTAQDVLLEEHNSSLRLSRSFVGVPDDPNSVAEEVDRIQRRDDRRDDSDADRTPPERIRMRDAPVGVPRFHMSNGCQQVTST